MYNKIGVAVAFSPRCEAIVAEASRLQKIFDAELVFIHVGKTKPDEKIYLEEVIESADVNSDKLRILWEKGSPASKILSVCEREQVDLLLAGALKRENFVKFYIGSIARHILRKANCSVLTLIEPSEKPKKMRRMVINATEGDTFHDTIQTGIQLAKKLEISQVTIFKAIKLFGLSMAIAGEEKSEKSYEKEKRRIIDDAYRETEALLEDIDTGDIRIHIKIAAGKPGHELKKCTEKLKADLLVIKAPEHKLGVLDRFFPHYIEQILSNLPANLLIDKQ
jgi:nucleotide-binding universal stress UspA family protein